ncbi:glycosyltransferase family 2 protein [uncultured Campylobacter sp.]|uniref:glycosyltransferase family 2 protein n=1 Tax=uncultured Campylobacter sp. TaxID=218934 RepID=UPI0026186BED|nr:glycosyltransferase family 2 protein [uncultured Campylobacter sp.]
MEESAFKPAFLLPYFNHPARIAELVHALAPIAPVLIVDDGSDEASKGALNGLAAQIYARAQNGGKGAAVCDGLAWAKELGFTHAFQIDADFQHDVSRCEEFLALAARQPAALICAAPAYDESAPKSRLHGRKIMNFWCAINTLSHRIKDAMCGFRIYPLKGIVPLLPHTKSRRMGFDAEILILAVRAGLEIKWLDLAVRYEAGGVSHFAPFRDNFGISLMHARLFCGLPLWLAKRALKRACDKFKKCGLRDEQSADEILQGIAGQNLCSGARRDSCKGAKEEMDGGANEKAGTEKCGDKAAAQSSLVNASSQHAAAKDGRDG